MGTQPPPDSALQTRPDPEGRPARRWPTALAVTAVCAFVAALGTRTLTTPDLGYHLAYGDHFLDTGRLVDGEEGLYAIGPQRQAGGQLGPGCWYDAEGRYRFPNANWLSQIAMALVHRLAGLAGLSVLLAALVAAAFALALATMRRLGVGWLAAAGGLLLMAMVAYERFLIRPEVFGYVVLLGQLWLLSFRGGPREPGEREAPPPPGPGWRTVTALVLLQWLLVNLHSYFLLGIGLTGAALADRLLRWLWHARRSRLRPESAPPAARARGAAVRLGVALAGQIIVCFLNPWTWRLALLPFQTLAFMQKHRIAGGELVEGGHPWAVIGEFFRPFAPGVFQDSAASYAYCCFLAVAAAGILAAAVRRRWAHLLVIAAMTGASLSMRRNIAPAALVAVPLALAACWEALAAAAGKLRMPRRPAVALLSAAALTGLAVYGLFVVVTDRFYSDERRAVRFGVGISRTVVPIGPAEWINRNKPSGRLWTDYNSSSNMHYFTVPHRPVPILTNTWAYPPDVMRRVLDYSRGRRPFREAASAVGCGIVVLRMDRTSIRLGRALVTDPAWSLVYLDALHVVFLRADGENAELARRCEIRPETLGLAAYKALLRGADPVSSYSTYLGGFTLAHLGWDTQAIDVFDYVLTEYPSQPHLYRVWNMKGTCLARRGMLRMLRKPNRDLRGKRDWHEARNCFLAALKLRSDYEPARENLVEIDRQIAAEKRGIVYEYPW